MQKLLFFFFSFFNYNVTSFFYFCLHLSVVLLSYLALPTLYYLCSITYSALFIYLLCILLLLLICYTQHILLCKFILQRNFNDDGMYNYCIWGIKSRILHIQESATHHHVRIIRFRISHFDSSCKNSQK